MYILELHYTFHFLHCWYNCWWISWMFVPEHATWLDRKPTLTSAVTYTLHVNWSSVLVAKSRLEKQIIVLCEILLQIDRRIESNAYDPTVQLAQVNSKRSLLLFCLKMDLKLVPFEMTKEKEIASCKERPFWANRAQHFIKTNYDCRYAWRVKSALDSTCSYLHDYFWPISRGSGLLGNTWA